MTDKFDIGLVGMICHKCKTRSSYCATSEPIEVMAFLNKHAIFLCLECGQKAVEAQSFESLGVYKDGR